MKITKNRIRILSMSMMLLLTVSCWEGFNDTLIGNESVEPAETELNTVETTTTSIRLYWDEPDMQNYSKTVVTWTDGTTSGNEEVLKGVETYNITSLSSGVEYTVKIKSVYSSGFESKERNFIFKTESRNYFFIYNYSDFIHTSNYLDYTCILMNDLDLTGKTFEGIGAFDSSNFTGTFDGNGHTISNISSHDSGQIGLFYGLNGAEVKNLRISNVSITGGTFTGALAGSVEASSITNCHISGTISGGKPTGGFAGNFDTSTVINCSFTGDVTGSGDDVGGFTGSMANSDFTGCWFSGNVTETESRSYIGGFAGRIVKSDANAISIKNCHALCIVTAPGCGSVGGFAGYIYSENSSYLTIQNCYAAGSGAVLVTGDANVGGFSGNTFGSSSNLAIIECYATGGVTGTVANTGGFVGYTHYAEITDCYCTGTVQGNTNVGGFVGNLDRETIKTCYTACEVTGSSAVGVFGGLLSRVPLNCYFMDSDYSGSEVEGQFEYLDEAERYVMASYDGFDQFGDVWFIDTTRTINGGLPYLKDLVP